MILAPPIFVRLFTDPVSAEAAYEVLLKRGYSANQINVVMSEFTKSQHSKNLPIHNGNLFKNGKIRCEWSADEAEEWMITYECSGNLQSELRHGGILIFVYARNDDDEVYLQNLWIDRATRLIA